MAAFQNKCCPAYRTSCKSINEMRLLAMYIIVCFLSYVIWIFCYCKILPLLITMHQSPLTILTTNHITLPSTNHDTDQIITTFHWISNRQLTPKMTSAEDVETAVFFNIPSPGAFQPDDQIPWKNVTPGFKSFSLAYYDTFCVIGGADDWQFVYEPWHPQSCQNLECAVPRKNTPTSICLEASYAAAKCASAPPVFICEKCAEMAAPDIPEETLLIKIIQPMGKMRTTCETKECKGQGKPCSVMCFSYECVRDNRYVSSRINFTHFNWIECEGRILEVIGSLSRHDVDGSKNVIWKCNFAFLQSFFNYSKSLCLKNVF